MGIFQGNQKSEEVIFTGLNYALYSRHDLNNTFTPFMMLHKNVGFSLKNIFVRELKGNMVRVIDTFCRVMERGLQN